MSKTTAGPTTSVSVGIADTLILAQNVGRREVTIVNDGANIVYLSFGGGAATANNGIRLNAGGGSYTTNNWSGQIRGIALTGATVVTVAEF